MDILHSNCLYEGMVIYRGEEGKIHHKYGKGIVFGKGIGKGRVGPGKGFDSLEIHRKESSE